MKLPPINDSVGYSEEPLHLQEWQKKIIDIRLKDYQRNPERVVDFDKTIDEIEKNLLIQ